MDFDPRTALGYARVLARPRRTGSGEEAAVRQEIARRLQQLGWTVEHRPFRYWPLVNAVIAASIVAGLLLIAIALWSDITPDWLLAVAIAILVSSMDRLIHAAQTRAVAPGADSQRPARFFPHLAAANLVAFPPHFPNDSAAPHLYLVAHYDSKSQIMPLGARVALSVAALGGIAAFAVLTLAGTLVPAFAPAASVAGVFTFIVAIPLVVLLLVKAGNASAGAIDNASGVGTVLHLAECLAAQPEPLTRLRVTVLLTGAEELGLLGAAAYVRQNETELRRQAASGEVYVLNLDGVGIAGVLHSVGAPGRLAALIRESGRDLGIPVKRFSLPGALFDHMPFARLGLDAVSLTVIGPASRAIHTPGDTADKLHPRGFEQAGRVAVRVMERLGTRHCSGSMLGAPSPAQAKEGEERPAKSACMRGGSMSTESVHIR